MRRGGGVGVHWVGWDLVQGRTRPGNPLEEWCRQMSSVAGVAEQRRSTASSFGEGSAEQVWWRRPVVDSPNWWVGREKNFHNPDFVHSTSGVNLWVEERGSEDSVVRPIVEHGADCEGSGRCENDSEKIETWRRLCGEGQPSESVAALELLVGKGAPAPLSLFYRVLRGCISQKDLVLGRRVHHLAVQRGYDSSPFLANHFIRMYASHGSLQDAAQVFGKLAAPDLFTWASIILAHADHGHPKQAIKLYQQMRQSAVKPDSYILVAVLKACARAVDLVSGKEVHADILDCAIEPNVFVGNCLVDMYAKCGSLVDARSVFDGLPMKTVVTWNSMIAGYAQNGLGHEALELHSRMQRDGISVPNNVTFLCLLKACASVGALHEGKELHLQIRERGLDSDVVVASSLVDMYAKCGSLGDARAVFDSLSRRDVVAWTAMITGYVQHGFGQEALALYARMQHEGVIQANRVTFACLLNACASVRALRQGKELHSQIQDSRLEGDVVVGSSLVDMYAKCGSVEDAQRVFDRLPTKNVVTWNAMVGGYAQHGLGQEALDLYKNMLLEGVTAADHVTFSCLLKACASIGAVDQGKQLHSHIQERGLESEDVLASSLVDMYVKFGNLDDARELFDRLPSKDAVTWNALLNGYAQHNNVPMAMQCFEDMLHHGVQPNSSTFVGLLVACSHAGLVDEGKQYFSAMKDAHGIEPSVYHYNCMVDLLGRSGRLDEAESLLQAMPDNTDIVGWISLLSACKSHGDEARAWRCFHSVTALEPQNSAAYALLASIYASAGRWREVESIENLRKAAGACKKPARAWIEVNSRVTTFIVGEERNDTSSKLNSVNHQLEDPRPRLHVQHSKPVTEAEKEDALCGHAEKLALAYGLLNTPDGTTLLVTKNLRMCDDCHNGTKMMSRTEKREIIVRDAHRVHHFVDGCCTCGDRH